MRSRKNVTMQLSNGHLSGKYQFQENMKQFKGLFNIQTPQDVFVKMEHDLKRLIDSPLDQYAAFDFFVTAEHLVDWLLPDRHENDKEASRARKALRDSNILLQVVSHIANGSKHFVALAKHQQSVEKTESTKGAFQADAMQSDSFQISQLIIHLHGQAVVELGLQIEVIDLSKRVLQFWKNHKLFNEIS